MSRRKRRLTGILVCVSVALAVALFLFVRRTQTDGSYLFIGDSYAARLESAGYSTGNVLIYAVPGITARQLDENKWEFPDMEPDKVVLMAGINSLAEMEEGAIQIEDQKALIIHIRELYDAPLYVPTVFHVGEPLLQHKPVLSVKNVAEYNRLLEEFCQETEGVIFFDPQEGFLDENGYLTRTEDNLHIAEDFLEQYYENIMREIR